MKERLETTPSIPQFVSDLAKTKFNHKNSEVAEPFRLGIDPFVHPASFAKEVETEFKKVFDTLDQENAEEEKNNENLGDCSKFALIDTLDNLPSKEHNLVDLVWGDARPAVPTSPFRVHPIMYAGISAKDKVSDIITQMKSKSATLSVFSALDDIAYMFNIRATGDVFSCPVGIAYATTAIKNDGSLETKIYCHPDKTKSSEIQSHFAQEGIELAPYEDIVPYIQTHIQETTKPKVWLDKSHSNYAISRIIPSKCLIDEQNAIVPMKACKNKQELDGMRKAHINDGVAFANFASWLENEIVVNKKKISEVEIDLVLTGERAKQPGFVEVSFPTIAGVGANGAIIHYRAQENELMKYLDTNQPILIDSGGQYEYGTTDVTRTLHFGTDDQIKDDFKDAYTRVLKGHIGLDSMIFPEGTPGFVVDVYARQHLWGVGKDYGHGTGHGVGAALNVHEGPMSISPRFGNKEGLKEGMVLSNEPGYYEDGNFGVRIENLLEIVEKNLGPSPCEDKKASQKKFLCFKRLTMIPIQKNLIKLELMTQQELDWIDSYHTEVYEKVSPLVEDGSGAKLWLQKSCSKILRK